MVEGLGERATLHVIDDADHGFHVPKRSGRTAQSGIRGSRRASVQTAGRSPPAASHDTAFSAT